MCYLNFKDTLKIAHFWLYLAILAIIGNICDGYDPKTVISHSAHHAKLADMQHTHICTQNLKPLSK